MSIVRGARPQSGFYVLSNAISGDSRLSWAARGILVFLLSKPDHWEVSVAALVNETAGSLRAGGQTKRDGVKAVLAELMSAGYLSRSDKPKHNADGSFSGYDYIVSETPKLVDASAEPCTDEPSPAEPSTAEPSPPHPTQVSTDSKKELKNQVKTESAARIRASRSSTSLAYWLKTCKEKGERAIEDDDSIFDYAQKQKMPDDFIRYAWLEFKRTFIEDDSKKQKDWRAHFRNAVRANWFKLWFIGDDGNFALTTRGKQVQREHEDRA